MPVPAVEEVEDRFERLVRNLDGLAVTVGLSSSWTSKRPPLRYGTLPEEVLQLGLSAALPPKTLVEQTEQEVAVEGVELVLAVTPASNAFSRLRR